MAEVQVNLPVNLQLRSFDERLTTDELATCSLFAGMKKLPPLRKNPGSVVLRRFGRGDVVCEQGVAGATAFYILTLDDMYRIREAQIKSIDRVLAKPSDRTSSTDFAGKESEPEDGEDEDVPARLAAMSEDDLRELRRKLASERDAMRASLDALTRDAKGAVHPRHVATARLLVDMAGPRGRRGLLHKLRELFLPKHRGDRANAMPPSIPIDGPADIETKTLSAPMFKGEIFGEMSCFNRVPRSATIIVEQECYVLEIQQSRF